MRPTKTDGFAMRKKTLLIFLIFSLVSFAFCKESSAEEQVSVINIESAEKSEYKKDQLFGGDCIILSGNVVISVSRGNDKTTISADRINYNRSSEMLYAEGNVGLEQSGSSSAGGEKITANSLLFNTSTFEGIFDNGRAVQTSSDAINLPSDRKSVV